MRKSAKRVVIFLLVAELMYLVLGNLAINLALTQDLINRIRPERLTVSWDSAWTWYPFRVSAKNVHADGQSPGQQWQVAMGEASASLSLLPLLARKVRVSNIRIGDITYFQRPRLTDDQDFADIRDYFAPIEGRNPESRSTLADANERYGGQENKGWEIYLENAQVYGSHYFWMYQLQAKVNGNASGNFYIQTRGGPLSLEDGELDVQLDALLINGDREISRFGEIKGKVALSPFKVKENRGIKSLDFLVLDANIALDTQSLKFLNPYLNSFHGMKVDGAGKVKGRAVLAQGDIKPGSRFKVTATRLDLAVIDFRLRGEGEIVLAVDEPGDEARLVIDFDAINAYTEKEQILLLYGNGLSMRATGPTKIIPRDNTAYKATQMSVSIPLLKVPDLRAYQRFLPEKWVFSLHGGRGELKGSADLSDSLFRADIELQSEQADVGFRELRFTSNLDIGLNIDSTTLEQGLVDVSGTHFDLNAARLFTEEGSAESWSAAIKIEKGHIRLNLEDTETAVSGTRHFVKTLKEKGFGPLLAASDEDLEISGNVSDLRWLNLLFNNPHGLSVSGSGAIDASLRMTSGWLEKGTRLTVAPQALGVDVLEYRADGGGSVELQVIKGGEFPDISLDIDVNDAHFGRKDDTEAFVQNIDISLAVVGYNLKAGEPEPDFDLRLSIPSARIKDMSVYNQYLPASSPVRILDGEADLEVDVRFQPDNAAGFVRLKTDGMTGLLDEQIITGDLLLEIALVGGVPADMEFDISGSSIVLDGVRVVGEEKSFRDKNWSAKIDLTRAWAVWKQPVRLDLEADLTMTDSTPIVSIVANERGKQDWLSEAMTVDDVEGKASLKIDNNLIQIPSAFVSSDKIDVGAKAVIQEDSWTGMIFVRYGKLKALLESKNDKRNLDVINTEKQFMEYSTNAVLESLMRESQ